jgi:hypothetical protein
VCVLCLCLAFVVIISVSVLFECIQWDGEICAWEYDNVCKFGAWELNMNNRNEQVSFRKRIIRTLGPPCVSYQHEIPETSENCHLTSFRTCVTKSGENVDQVMWVCLMFNLSVRVSSLNHRLHTFLFSFSRFWLWYHWHVFLLLQVLLVLFLTLPVLAVVCKTDVSVLYFDSISFSYLVYVTK